MAMNDTTHRYTLALEIGEEAIRQGKWQQAITCFQTALTGLPREPRVYNGLGDTHLALADRGRALACYKEAARLAGNNANYVKKVAELQEQQGLIPDAAHSRVVAGDILWGQGEFDQAEAHWAYAIYLQGNLIAARERLALAGRQRGDLSGGPPLPGAGRLLAARWALPNGPPHLLYRHEGLPGKPDDLVGD